MPFRSEHNCITDRTVINITGIEAVKTKWGVIRRVVGVDKKGVRKQRGIRIPVRIPLRIAQRICQSCNGEFSPATPEETQRTLMSEFKKMTMDEKKQILEIFIDRFELSEIKCAKWNTSYVNELPDSSFALIVPGGKKDEGGKTVPRSKRKLPYKDKDGKIDKAHLRNALARVNQADAPSELKRRALQKLLRVAKSIGVETQKSEKYKLEELTWMFRMYDSLEV